MLGITQRDILCDPVQDKTFPGSWKEHTGGKLDDRTWVL